MCRVCPNARMKDVLTGKRVHDIETTAGRARARVFPVGRGVPRATLVLGHGAASGIDTWDLELLADRLPAKGVEVVLVEQPWLVAGRKVTDPHAKLDAAFREVVTDLRRSGEGLRRLVVGGRSQGARVACRTAASVKADAVLCLAFPLHRQGKSRPLRSAELIEAASSCPVSVLQGERDGFGSPVEVASAIADGGGRGVVVSIPWADHEFDVPGKAPVTVEEVGMVLVEAARLALLSRPGNVGPLVAR